MFVEYLETALQIVVNVLLIIILIVGIILGIKSIKTIDKIEKVVDDVNDKVQSLNGLFNVIDFTTDKLVSVTDRVVDGVTGLIGRLFSKKNKKLKEEEE